MKLRLVALLVLLIGFSISCSKDDDNPNAIENFYDNADTTALPADLIGIWAIFNAGFEGNIVEIPEDSQECGRNFIIFSENGIYAEYLFQDSSCEYIVNTLIWELNDGIITLSNQFNQSDDLVVTTLNADELVFKSRIDVDEDGTLDVLTLYLQPYIPLEIDMISYTFGQNNQNESIIEFNWQPYEGYNGFNRYEIYRGFGNSCTYESALLVETITDVNITQYIDLEPPVGTEICYFMRTYTNQGLLGQTVINQVNTEFLKPLPVGLNPPIVNNNEIELSWQQSETPYFSHYEITYSNYEAGIIATGMQEYAVAEIYDREILSYLDANPPYLENPFYQIYVHDIFGNKTYAYYPNVATSLEVEYKRDEIISLKEVRYYTLDTDEPVIYFYGRASGETYNNYNIFRFNYNTLEIESISNLSPPAANYVPIKYINSTTNGQEVAIVQGSDVYIYNANTMEYKYELDPGFIDIDDFLVTSNGYWVFVSGENVYTYSRDNANLTQIDFEQHYPDSQGYNNHKVFELNADKLLVGYYNEDNSYLYTMEADGQLSAGQTVSVPVKQTLTHKTFYNAEEEYIVNFDDNRLYSTVSFALIESFEQPYFPSGISIDGIKIFGSNNDPDWQITEESIHVKEAVVFNRITQQNQTISIDGYPHIIFENYNGQIMSISSGLKKDNIQQNINDRGDLFVEIVEAP